jgi:hypothetical protein
MLLCEEDIWHCAVDGAETGGVGRILGHTVGVTCNNSSDSLSSEYTSVPSLHLGENEVMGYQKLFSSE